MPRAAPGALTARALPAGKRSPTMPSTILPRLTASLLLRHQRKKISHPPPVDGEVKKCRSFPPCAANKVFPALFSYNNPSNQWFYFLCATRTDQSLYQNCGPQIDSCNFDMFQSRAVKEHSHILRCSRPKILPVQLFDLIVQT
jgi:hypothetical protein